MYKLMLIEDDTELSALIQENLERYGYTVVQPENFLNIEDEFTRIKPDLILLDINLPYYDGYYLCRAFRKQSNVPILIISARNQELDQIMAIELGADDYITKPFTFDILQSKVKATTRRVYGEYAANGQNLTCAGQLCINADTLVLTFREKKINLSKNEFKLMKKLIDNKNTFISREELIEEVWDSITFVEDNTLTVNMTRIKHILSELGFDDVIKSKRGVGYMFHYSNSTRGSQC
ncbi:MULTISPECIES: response regulator transcription factor [unclassified Lysinibacillus]|uniref:response regulator transcription factor n=1 Tax=unclassified Lysinibacillus TaxID=2636778 RepID=UPI002010F964|nr:MULTISPECIES: response regulator transcription factor [unclassified Lysinibacillus]MCL1697863.1 response regulator transcription factor [Lysinibacillus sp. BPa_S21]MCL1702882.1 response regulator transcription factor [Lysinibacillus sp. Bpr_S20]